MTKLYSLAVFLCAIFVINSLPTVRKENAAAKNSAKPAEANNALEAELGKLKQDGISVQKTEQTMTENVDGKMQVVKTEKETVTDAKTGELVASVAKTTTKDKNGQKQEAHVDVPAAGIHQDVTGPEAENVELIPADDVARYIFDTSDIDGVKTAVQSLLDNKRISKKAADDYVHEIRERLNAMHEQALKQMTVELEERKKEEDGVYKDMLSIAGILNDNADTEQALYLYAKKLYAAYRTEGDEYAKEILTQFTNDLQQEADAGNINESVQDSIYDIILKALKDVNEELETTGNGAQETPAAEPENAKSKLPKD